MAQSAPDGDSESEEGSALNRQTALFALKLISRLLAGNHPAQFAPVSTAGGRFIGWFTDGDCGFLTRARGCLSCLTFTRVIGK